MSTAPDPGFTDTWIRAFAASASATEPELTALDQQVGDGDFGANLVAGLEATLRRLDESSGAAGTAAGPLEAAASAFLDEVGGTSGPLFGLLFQELAAAVGAAADELDAGALAKGVAGGLAAIQRVGEAAVGDKTLVDALAPAAEALDSADPAGGPADALGRAAAAAWQGVADTARLTARRGRASYVGGRAAGVPDPGAVGVGLLFSSAAGAVTSLTPYLAGLSDPSGTEPGR